MIGPKSVKKFPYSLNDPHIDKKFTHQSKYALYSLNDPPI